MAKLTTTDLTSLTSNEANAVSSINANFAAVETAMELTLTRTGTSPNAMEASLDMNNYDILNCNVGNFANLLVGGVAVASQYGFQNIVVAGQSTVVADTATDTLTFAAGSNITLTTNAATDTVTINASIPAIVLPDGDYGDITISGTGTVMTVDTGLDVAKLADGSVSNIELQYINTLSSNAQTQLNGKQPLGDGLTDITALPDPIADRVLFYDQSAGAYKHLEMGTNISITGTTLNVASGTAALADGDYGDIVVSGSGAIMSIDAGVIVNADVAAAAAIDATKIADGTVSSVEFQYINTLSSNAQTQLDGKQPLDSDLTTIAGLVATTDNFLQSKASAWASRTPTQVTADLISVVGDSGAGGTKGLVPAPGTGDAAAGKFLKADATWAVPSGGGAWTATSWTYSVNVTSVEFLNLSAYSELMILVRNVTLGTTGIMSVQVSSDNGVTWKTTSGEYVYFQITGVGGNDTAITLYNTNATAARNAVCHIVGWNLVQPKPVMISRSDVIGWTITDVEACNALRLIPTGGGNITGGSIYLYHK